jgi:hypothetical protein
MKKALSIALVIILLVAGLFVLTGCGENGNGGNSENGSSKPANSVEISKVFGKGKFTLYVPKKEDGTPKYEFTETKPEKAKGTGSFYLETDNTVLSFSTKGWVYNTSKDYKAKYGEDTKATWGGYIEFMNDESISSRPKLSGMEQFEINGRKALRYYSREGGSGDYKYFGYNYMIDVDDIYTGSNGNIGVYYKLDEYPKEAQEFDQETLDIIKSLIITPASAE